MSNIEHIKISKNFSVDDAGKFRMETYKMISTGTKTFHIDFSECSFVDSTGLGVLVSLFKRCQENGAEMVLTNLSDDIMKVFHMTRLDNVFTFK